MAFLRILHRISRFLLISGGFSSTQTCVKGKKNPPEYRGEMVHISLCSFGLEFSHLFQRQLDILCNFLKRQNVILQHPESGQLFLFSLSLFFLFFHNFFYNLFHNFAHFLLPFRAFFQVPGAVGQQGVVYLIIALPVFQLPRRESLRRKPKADVSPPGAFPAPPFPPPGLPSPGGGQRSPPRRRGAPRSR